MCKINKKEIAKDSSGEVVVEATLLVVIIILTIFFTFNVACVFYNRQVVNAVATEAAASVAASSNSESRDPFVGYVASKYFKYRDVYRYNFSDFCYTKMGEQAKEKAEWYSSYFLHMYEFSERHDTGISPDITVSIEERDDLGTSVVNVVISKEYPVFVMNPMSYFGLDPTYKCVGSGTAICYDPLHQINSMALADEVAHGLNDAFVVTSTLDPIEVKAGHLFGGVTDLVNKVRDVIGNIGAAINGN